MGVSWHPNSSLPVSFYFMAFFKMCAFFFFLRSYVDRYVVMDYMKIVSSLNLFTLGRKYSRSILMQHVIPLSIFKSI